MTVHHDLPTPEDLQRLSQPHDNAVTVYLPTSHGPEGRNLARTALKSAVDQAISHLKLQGSLNSAGERGLRDQLKEFDGDGDVWGSLSSSLVVLLTPESNEEFILPNDLEEQWQASRWFDLGQLVRAVAAGQHAWALSLSTKGWSLWEAVPERRAVEIEVPGHAEIADATSATNRDAMPGRSHEKRLGADEGRKLVLEAYAKRVTEAVRAELLRRNPDGSVPLFVFAAEPLLSMFAAVGARRAIVRIPGSPDRLGADQIDAAMRERLPELNARRVSGEVERIANDLPRGLVALTVEDIGKAAAAGAVDTLVYEFTVDVPGDYDPATGQVTTGGDDDHDVLSRIALTVMERGGSVVPVRDAEVRSDVWNGLAVAHLRFTV